MPQTYYIYNLQRGGAVTYTLAQSTSKSINNQQSRVPPIERASNSGYGALLLAYLLDYSIRNEDSCEICADPAKVYTNRKYNLPPKLLTINKWQYNPALRRQILIKIGMFIMFIR